MKRILSRFLILLVLVAMLAACATPTAEPTEKPAATEPPTEAPAPTEPPPAEEKKIEIDFWNSSSGSRDPGVQGVIEGFHKAYPNITVNHTSVPYAEFQSKVAAAVPAGTGPDLVLIYYGWASLWEKSGFIAPLPPEVQTELEEEFIPYIEVTQLRGEHYGVPMSIRNTTLFYNVDLLKEAGWDNPPANWEELRQAAKDCAKYDDAGNITQAGMYLEWARNGWNWWRLVMQGFGAKPFSDDGRQVLWNASQEARDAFKYMTGLVTEDKVSSEGFYESNYAAFAAGKSCMLMTSYIIYVRDNVSPDVHYEVTVTPTGPAGAFSNAVAWPVAMTTKATQDPDKFDAVVKFLMFAASQEGQSLYSDATGELPCRLDMLDNPKYTEDKHLGPQLAQMSFASAPLWIDELAERQCALDMYDAVVLGAVDPDQALDEGTACAQKIRDEFFAD